MCNTLPVWNRLWLRIIPNKISMKCQVKATSVSTTRYSSFCINSNTKSRWTLTTTNTVSLHPRCKTFLSKPQFLKLEFHQIRTSRISIPNLLCKLFNKCCWWTSSQLVRRILLSIRHLQTKSFLCFQSRQVLLVSRDMTLTEKVTIPISQKFFLVNVVCKI